MRSVPRSRGNGFSLLEVLVAMFVLTMGITFATELMKGAITNDHFARGRLVANQIALEKAEEFRRADHAKLQVRQEFKEYVLYKSPTLDEKSKASFFVMGAVEPYGPQEQRLTVNVKWLKGAPNLNGWDKALIKGQSSYTTLISTGS